MSRAAMAREVADRLLSLAQRWAPAAREGGAIDPADPATWRAVAKAMGLAVVEERRPGEGRGLYVPAGEEDGPVEWGVPGLVWINVAYPEADQAFVDYLNLALDAFSIPLRVETKHSWIARRLVEARAQEAKL